MLDYDDTGGGHVSIATVPVAFAVAESLGGVSGRELSAAIAAGAEVMTRLRHSVDIPDWTLIKQVRDLENVADAGEIIRLLT
jgi:2-methylcitrate dehydratase PrpD